jgi:hypothetical protein
MGQAAKRIPPCSDAPGGVQILFARAPQSRRSQTIRQQPLTGLWDITSLVTAGILEYSGSPQPRDAPPTSPKSNGEGGDREGPVHECEFRDVHDLFYGSRTRSRRSLKSIRLNA